MHLATLGKGSAAHDADGSGSINPKPTPKIGPQNNSEQLLSSGNQPGVSANGARTHVIAARKVSTHFGSGKESEASVGRGDQFSAGETYNRNESEISQVSETSGKATYLKRPKGGVPGCFSQASTGTRKVCVKEVPGKAEAEVEGDESKSSAIPEGFTDSAESTSTLARWLGEASLLLLQW